MSSLKKTDLTIELSFQTKYETATGRALYILAKKFYGSLTKMGEEFKVTRQFMTRCCKDGAIPLEYGKLLGNKFSFHPALLNYETFFMVSENPVSFLDLIRQTTVFSKKEKEIILEGNYLNKN